MLTVKQVIEIHMNSLRKLKEWSSNKDFWDGAIYGVNDLARNLREVEDMPVVGGKQIIKGGD